MMTNWEYARLTYAVRFDAFGGTPAGGRLIFASTGHVIDVAEDGWWPITAQLGATGWELVTKTYIVDMFGKTEPKTFEMIFKRPLAPASDLQQATAAGDQQSGGLPA